MSIEVEKYETDNENIRNYLATERYESKYEAVREGVGNAFAAIQRATRDGYLEMGDGKISISLEGGVLTIRDNGDGVPMSNYRELLQVAKSPQEDPFVLGTYGIGRFSLVMLSSNDYFDFVTHAREDGSSYGIRFAIDSPQEIDETLESPGSLVRVDVEDSFEGEDLVDFCEAEFRFLPVDVEVHVGDETHEFGGLSLEDLHDNSFYWENGDVELSFSRGRSNYSYTSEANRVSGGIVLYQNMPTRVPRTRISYQINLDANIKRDDGTETVGPHGESVQLPQTTNDRGRMKTEEWNDFKSWASDVFCHIAEERIRDLLEKPPQEYLEDPDFILGRRAVHDTDLPQEDKDLIETYSSTVSAFHGEYGSMSVSDIILEGYDKVFVGKSINKRRSEIVKDLYDNPGIFKVKNLSYNNFDYDSADLLGWELLKDIPLNVESLREMGVSQETISEVASGNVDKEFLVHTKGRGANSRYVRKKYTCDSVEDLPRKVGLLILFSDNGDLNISDHFHQLNRYVAMSTMSGSKVDELVDNETVFRAEDIDWDNEVEVPFVVHDDKIPEDVIMDKIGEYQRLSEDGLDARVLINGEYTNNFYWIGDDCPFPQIFKTKSSDAFEVYNEFPDLPRGVQKELGELGSDSSLWSYVK